MRKFKVISLAVSGKNNKIFRTHDVINGNQVHDPDDLVLKKHLKEITDEPVVEAPPTQDPPPTPATDENQGTDGTDESDENVSHGTLESTGGENRNVIDPESLENMVGVGDKSKPGMDEIETADIKKILKERGVTFNKNASKEELYRLFIGL